MEESRQRPLDCERKGRCGKAEYGRGAGTGRRAGGIRLTATTRALGPPGPRRGRRSPRRLFCLGERPLVTVPGCHFVAWPPFRAAEGGRAGRRGRGGGRARAPLPERTGERVPFVLRLRAAPRPAPEARARGTPGRPPREACTHSPRLLRPLSPPQVGLCPPHPCCVKGIHFVGEGSGLYRGKLECHPEKDGALVEAAQPFVSSAWSHDGALPRSHTEQLRPRGPTKVLTTGGTERSVPLKKKKWCL